MNREVLWLNVSDLGESRKQLAGTVRKGKGQVKGESKVYKGQSKVCTG